MVKFYQGVSGGMAPEDLKPVNRAQLKAERRVGDNPRIPEPVIDFSANDTTVLEDTDVTFTATISGQWTSGQYQAVLTGGAPQAEDILATITPASPVAIFQFADPGTYDVYLTVKGPGGETTLLKTSYMVIS